MASKLVPLNEAASQLGVSPDELNEMRSRQEIYGYRDGASWKFKQDDIDKLIADRSGGAGSGIGSGLGSGIAFDTGSGIGFDLGSEVIVGTGSSIGTGSGTGSGIGSSIVKQSPGIDIPIDGTGGSEEIVLLSEVELGESGEGTSSTIIGQSKQRNKPDSDLKIKPPKPTDSGSDVMLLSSDDDVLALGGGSELPIDLSDSKTVVKSGGGSDKKKSPGLSALGSDLSLAPDSEIRIKGDSSLRLDDDAEDVLGGSGGSDLTHRPSDSGILLVDPADSGLSLDRPLDLTGSDPRLGATTEFAADSSELEIKGDDDFLLTPLEESGEDDSDSGSQVIMLDTEGEFDDATATLLASQIPGMESSMLAVDEPGTAVMSAEQMMGAGAATARGPVQTIVVGMREAPFSAFTVVGLTAATLLLAVAGTMMYDIMRNMWSWDTPYGTSSLFMDAIIGK